MDGAQVLAGVGVLPGGLGLRSGADTYIRA